MLWLRINAYICLSSLTFFFAFSSELCFKRVINITNWEENTLTLVITIIPNQQHIIFFSFRFFSCSPLVAAITSFGCHCHIFWLPLSILGCRYHIFWLPLPHLLVATITSFGCHYHISWLSLSHLLFATVTSFGCRHCQLFCGQSSESGQNIYIAVSDLNKRSHFVITFCLQQFAFVLS